VIKMTTTATAPIKTAVVLQHAPGEGPERIGALCAERGIGLDIRHLYRGDPVPTDLGAAEMLVVMGGPMGVGDVDDPRYPYLSREIACMAALAARDRPVLGVCLGAQLLAAAAGARVYPNGRREVGWAPVDFIGAGGEAALRGIGAREVLFHWHGDTFDLPRGAVHLASTEVCRHQAFRLGARLFGLQFHCELGAATIASWVREDAAYVVEANGPDGGRQILADNERYLAAATKVGDRLLGNILDVITAA
jgi:GMP synthase-like glutamine amidotransferase